MKRIIGAASFISMLPSLAFAQMSRVTNAQNLIDRVDYLVNSVVWVLISLALVFIVWNVVQFIRNASGEKRGEYQNGIMWGIVGLAVILSIWGLVAILMNTFGTGNRYEQGNAATDLNSLMFKNAPPTSTTVSRPASTITPRLVPTPDYSSVDDDDE